MVKRREDLTEPPVDTLKPRSSHGGRRKDVVGAREEQQEIASRSQVDRTESAGDRNEVASGQLGTEDVPSRETDRRTEIAELRNKLDGRGRAPTEAILQPVDCFSCLKKRRLRGGLYECTVFRRFYFDDDKPPKRCWAYTDDPWLWKESLGEILRYADRRQIQMDKGIIPSTTAEASEVSRFRGEVDRDLVVADFQWEQDRLKQIHEAYYEDTRKRPGDPHGGGGEKADRTNKMFGPARMKDNRYIEPWSGFFKVKKSP